MDKKTTIILIIALVLILAVAAGGYFWWSSYKKSKLKYGGGTAEDVTNSATKGVLPSLQTNPLEDKPDLNPVDKTNPYANIKTNPF